MSMARDLADIRAEDEAAALDAELSYFHYYNHCVCFRTDSQDHCEIGKAEIAEQKLANERMEAWLNQTCLKVTEQDLYDLPF